MPAQDVNNPFTRPTLPTLQINCCANKRTPKITLKIFKNKLKAKRNKLPKIGRAQPASHLSVSDGPNRWKRISSSRKKKNRKRLIERLAQKATGRHTTTKKNKDQRK